MRDVAERVYELEKAVEESITETQYRARSAVLDRIVRHIKASGDDYYILYSNLIMDWPSFLAYELDTLEGVPLFLSPWQLEADFAAEKYNNVWVKCCRQSGKTVWESTRALKHMIREKNTSVLAIAPTAEQLVVRDNFRNYINQSDFLREQFVMEDAGGKNAQEEIRFAANNSSFKPLNMSGDPKRGKSAKVIMIDEFQLLTYEKYMEVVHPMVTSAFSKKKLYRFMTPSYLYRPDLDTQYDNAKKSKDILTIEIDTWQALDEGIRKPTRELGAGSMQEIFSEENIRCPYVEACGACPGFLPHWFAGPPRECMMCFKGNDTFMQEHMAKFPLQSEQFFPANWMHAIKRDVPLLDIDQITRLRVPTCLGVDLGGLEDPTEIIVNTVRTDSGTVSMHTVGWVHVPPIGGEGADSSPNLAFHADAVKRVYHKLKPVKIACDVTRKEDTAKRMISGDDAIPKIVFITTPGAEKHGLPGIWMTGEIKDQIYRNHRRMVGQRLLSVNSMPQKFWSEYFVQHTGVRAEGDGKTSYLKFKMPKQDHIVDAAANASFVATDYRTKNTSYDFAFVPR